MGARDALAEATKDELGAAHQFWAGGSMKTQRACPPQPSPRRLDPAFKQATCDLAHLRAISWDWHSEKVNRHLT